MTLSGSCLCGAVQYELSQEPVWAHNCHCSRCRKTSGTAYAANLFFRLEAFRYTKGEDEVQTFKPPEAEFFTHHYCRHCGSTLPFPNEKRGLVGIPMGSLDDDPAFAPRAHIWFESKALWSDICDSLPRHPEALGTGDPS